MNENTTFKWWHAVLIFLVANVISSIPVGYNGDEIFYNNFLLPSIAPPAWAFAPVWLFNNITSLYALYIVANLPDRSRSRTYFLIFEGINWVLFAIFATVYFWMRSPILGAVDTVLGLVLTIISLSLAIRLSKKAAIAIVPRLLWLLLATYVSVYAAVFNKDEFFNAGPFVSNLISSLSGFK